MGSKQGQPAAPHLGEGSARPPPVEALLDGADAIRRPRRGGAQLHAGPNTDSPTVSAQLEHLRVSTFSAQREHLEVYQRAIT